MRLVFLIVFLVGGKLLFAQPDLGKALQNIIQNNEPKLLAKLDTRNGFIANTAIKAMGVKVGFNFDNTLHLGVGYHWLAKGSKEKLLERGNLVKLNYISVFGEYWFYKKEPFYCSMPLQMGIGTIRNYPTLTGGREENMVLLYEAMLTGEYRPIKYVGVGLGLGYRLNFIRNTFGVNLTSPIYALKFNCYIGDIYTDLIKK